MRRPPAGALASRNFRLLLGCDVVSGMGNAVALVATPFAVLAIGGSAADVGYVTAGGLVPMLMFLLLGGVVADRLPRHMVMMAANVTEAIAQAGSAALLLTGTARVWELLALAAVRGTGVGFYFPAAQGLLPQTVPPGQRAQANAISRVARNGAQIGGSALGGVLIGVAGPGWGLAVDAAGFAVAAIFRAGMRFPDLPATPSAGLIAEMREGWNEFVARRWLWVIVAEFGCMMAITSGTISVLGPVIAQTRLGGARSWGFILAAYGIGALLGGIVMIRYRPQRMLLVASIAAGVFSVLLFALAVPLSVPLIEAAALIVGACAEVFGVNWVTTMQQEIPHDLLSRLSAFDLMGSLALAPVGVALAGPIAGVVGATTVITAGGVIIVVLTVAVLLVPEVRQMRRQVQVQVQAAESAAISGQARKAPRADPDATPATAGPG